HRRVPAGRDAEAIRGDRRQHWRRAWARRTAANGNSRGAGAIRIELQTVVNVHLITDRALVTRIAFAFLICAATRAASQQLVGYSPSSATRERELEASA